MAAKKPRDILTCALLGALAALLPFLGRAAFDFAFWSLAAALVLNLALAVRRRRRAALWAARRRADPGHFLADTGCFLEWERLGPGLDAAAAAALTALLRPENRDCRRLKPLVDQALARLRKNRRQEGGHAGVWAYQGFCLALRGQILGRETRAAALTEYPDLKWGGMARKAYARAAALAPEEASLAAEWGRSLEALSLSLEALNAAPEEIRASRLAALEKFDRALELDPEFRPAWRSRGRLLGREAFATREPAAARALLFRSVKAYEEARRGGSPDGAFYGEFGRFVFALAQMADKEKDHYCRYAARLFILAAETDPGDAEALFSAGRALTQAAALNEEARPAAARDLYREALGFFKEAARQDQGAADSREEAARRLADLFRLAPEKERAEGRGEAYGLLEEAAVWAGQAAGLAPTEERLAGWAEILSSLAEYGREEMKGRRWKETAVLYGRAARSAGVAAERAAVDWHNWAYALAARAETGPAASRRRLLRLAARKYERAAALNGDDLITLESWGDALAALAALTGEPAEAARWRGQAAAKYRRAIRLYPDQAGPWRHWSVLNQSLARAERNPARRRELWRAAVAKLEAGARVAPSDPLVWSFWGRLMMELLGEGPEYERPLLTAAALEKFEKALELDREDDETWSWLGRARLEAADLAEEFNFNGGPLNNALQAGRHFQTACSLDPTEAAYWADWGRALFKVSQIADSEASSLAALKEAYEKYLTAAALNPAEGEHHADLGHILYQWGWRMEDDRVKADRFHKAYEHCGEAGRLAPHDPNVWRNWAKVVEALAALEDDPVKSSAWQREADEKYYRADALESPDFLRRH